MSGGATREGTRGLAVTRLTLNDFRSYAYLRLDCSAAPVVLTGPNGAGKTNLLEAVSFLVPGRGLRRARLSDVTRRPVGDEPPPASWAVAAVVGTPNGPLEIGTGLDPMAKADRAKVDRGGTERNERRVVRLDGQTARSQSVLGPLVGAVWLTPQMDRLFTEGASGRRRFLDRLVFGLDPAHAGRLSAYEHAMRERARLLRSGDADPAWLKALEEAMAERGVAVAAARRDVVERLNRACAAGIGPFPQAVLAVSGAVEGWLAEMPALAAEDRLRASLAAARRLDAEIGGSAEGPHRSDLLVWHGAKNMPAELCSTGEQKALLIAIVLADARLQALARGAAPLMLLDEVAAHLDAERRAALYDEICALGAQAWLTGTDEALFAPLEGRAQFFRVRDAAVMPRSGDAPLRRRG